MGKTFAKKLGVEIWGLDTLGVDGLRVIGAGENEATVFGWAALEISIPKIKSFKDRAIPVLVTTDQGKVDSETSVHVTLGTNVLRDLIGLASESEMEQADQAWNQAYFACAHSASARCEENSEELFSVPLHSVRRREVPPLTQVKFECTAKIPKGYTGYAVAESRQTPETQEEPYFPAEMLKVRSGEQRCTVFVTNLTLLPQEIGKGQVIGQLTAATPEKEIDSGGLPDFDEKKVNPEGQDTLHCGTTIPIPEELSPEANPQVTMSVEERKKVLLESLNLDGLKDEPPELQQKVREFFSEFHDIFSLHETDLGKALPVKHNIKLTDHAPFKERFRRIPDHLLEEVKTELRNMLRIGVIKPSDSPWANAVVLARKKGGALRMCIDFRKLNLRTVKDAYSLPRIEEVMHALRGASWFSSIDLKSGFWHVPLDDESKPYTAFTAGPLGFYEFERMPFGLCNAPATFQRLMEHSLRDLNMQTCIIYIDDIVTFALTVEQLLDRLRQVFERLRKTGMKMNPKKCDFFQRELHYLGHVVGADGVKPDPSKVQTVLDWPAPKTPKQVRSFLGFAGYYRRFIKDFAKMARPMQQFTKGDFSARPNQSIEHLWTEECEQSLNALKKAVTSHPVLAYVDSEKPFRLVTDASTTGMGAALYQKQEDGVYKPVAFASTNLKGAEKNYPAHKLEFYAMKWAITQQFNRYLWGGKEFEVNTDNNPLTYVLTTAKLDACGHRWVAELAGYNFSIKYLKGTRNVVADALSRIDWHKIPPDKLDDNPKIQALDPEAVQQALDGSKVDPQDRPETMIVMGARQSIQGEPIQPLSTGHATDWEFEQSQDPVIRAYMDWQAKPKRSRGLLKDALPKDDSETDLFLRNELHFKTYAIPNEQDDGTSPKGNKLVLYRRVKIKDKQPEWQFVVPRSWRGRALKGCHDDAAHLGVQRTVELLQERFWWPRMAQEAAEYCKRCKTCTLVTGKVEKEPLIQIHVTAPGDLYHIDFTKLPAPLATRLKCPVNVMVVTDHFTRFAQAYITKDQSAVESAGAVFTHCNLFGIPARILTDQGKNFESKLMQELCKQMGVKKIRTSPGHPQCNGQAERFNRTLYQMIQKLEPHQKEEWDQWLPRLVHAYNCTRNSATGYSPFFLFFGRRPRLEMDRVFPTRPNIGGGKDSPGHHIGYVDKLRRMMDWTNRIASRTEEREMKRHKRLYDKRVRAILLRPGDKVLVKVEPPRGKYKLLTRWEDHTYTVVSQVSQDMPVYRVQRDDTGKVITRHRNSLFPLLQLADETPGEQPANSESTGESNAKQGDESVTPEHSAPGKESEGPEPGPSGWKAAASAQLLRLARALPPWKASTPE